ncbi:MAG: tRNA uridine-5-carboxymethylaminomethyl(34) synthesis GTPase MnmE [Acidobacteriia bacterium]|nr:tRNA uridine-5-carboxymethylaminomethyl(34) synthesis GTPase MnmE [Terriglobia bacterium]
MILSDTIVALSTPPGRGGIGIVRLSGPEALSLARQMLRSGADGAGGNGMPEFEPRHATLTQLVHLPTGNLMDHCVLTFFEKPHSYTGEDVVELSCHGAPVVLEEVVRQATELGARLAEPGEFTLRAFFNGRVDLIQAEAVRDLIEAKTLFQAQVAIQQAHGSLSKILAPTKEKLVHLIAELEAGIDFAEDDVSFLEHAEILKRVNAIQAELEPLIRSYSAGRVIKEGLSLAIVGRPNVGKSSLFNRLLATERAIVTALPGTTRDTISEPAQIHGLPIHLVDTAGIRLTTNIVEKEGVTRAYAALAESDLVLVVLDGSTGLEAEDASLLEQVSDLGHIVVLNKSDLPRRVEPSELPNQNSKTLEVSAKTGEGIELLRDVIFEAATGAQSRELVAHSLITNLRQEQLLKECQAGLQAAVASIDAAQPHELILLDLYRTLKAFDSLTGATTVDDVLGTIFSKFCVGK